MQGRAVLVLGEMGTAPLQVSTVPPESFCIQPSSLRLTWRDVGADKCYPPPAECYPPPAEAGPEVDTVQLPSQITPVTAVSPLSYSLPTVPPFPACPTSCSVTVVYAVPVTVALMHTPSAACPAFPVTPVHTELLSPASASGPPPAAEPPSKEAHRVICLSAGESPRLPSQGVKRNPSPWPSVPVSAPPPCHPPRPPLLQPQGLCTCCSLCLEQPPAPVTGHSQCPPRLSSAVTHGSSGHRCGVPFLVALRASRGRFVSVCLSPSFHTGCVLPRQAVHSMWC